NCPICFANANAAGYVYEPSFEQIEKMLQALRDLRPVPATAVQFSGGEPTIHPRFLDILSRARDLGFSNIQIATNGLKIADFDFARRAQDAGLHTLYLQFDGIGPEIHRTTRGRDIWDQKLQVVENCRRLDLKICLVPTIIRTVNDDQVGPIFRFAVENVDVINAISYQPICFSGRMDTRQRLQQRYTLGDLAHDIAAASGAVVERDFYPLSIVLPLSQFLEAVTGDPKVRPSCHTDCAFGTYFFVSEDKTVHPFPRVLDVEAMFGGMNRFAQRLRGKQGRLGYFDKLRLFRLFKTVFRKEAAPPDLSIDRFLQTLQGMVDKHQGRGSVGTKNYRTLMAAGMHFQDRYNFDVERVKRCVIPYSTPAGLIPFCAYNAGPTYRHLIEKLYARRSAQP
ncbi:MAG: radical SAM protein, partial [Sedimentisphaerales bacterium]|nr:radical SAM protein [Sedimentisphaerales bacterium]